MKNAIKNKNNELKLNTSIVDNVILYSPTDFIASKSLIIS